MFKRFMVTLCQKYGLLQLYVVSGLNHGMQIVI